jgi:hypothetical protein
MMRLARPALPLIVFCWLVSAATANAECAWVLWIEEWWTVAYGVDERPTTWTLVQARRSEADCERALVEKIKVLSKQGDAEVSGNIINRTFAGGHAQTNITQSERVICLPDTVDPRGAKSVKP